MTLLSYAALAGASLTLVLLFVRPRWGFLALILMLPWMDQITVRLGMGLNFSNALYLAALFSIATWFRALPPRGVLLPIVGYVVCMFFSIALLFSWFDPTMYGTFGHYFFLRELRSQLWPLLMLFIAFALGCDRRTRNSAVSCLVVTIGVASIISLLTAGSGGGDASAGEASDRLTGALYRNPNNLGGFLGCFLAVSLWKIVEPNQKKLLRIGYAVIYAAGAVALAYSKSRGGWIAFLIGHVVFLHYWNRKLLVPVVATAALVIVSAYSLSLLPEAIETRIEETFSPTQSYYQSAAVTGRIDSSAAKRLVLYQMGLEMFLDSPVWGHGFFGFRLLDHVYGPKYGIHRNYSSTYRGTDPESMYLQVAVDYGIIGLVLATWLGLTLLRHGIFVVRRSASSRYFGAIFLSVFSATAFYNLTQAAFVDIQEVAIPFWMLTGLMLREYAEGDESNDGASNSTSEKRAFVPSYLASRSMHAT